jgi:hypothetical protein
MAGNWSKYLTSAQFCSNCTLESVCDDCCTAFDASDILRITFVLDSKTGTFVGFESRFHIRGCACFKPCTHMACADTDDACECTACSSTEETCCNYEWKRMHCDNVSDPGHDTKRCMGCFRKRCIYDGSVLNISRNHSYSLHHPIPDKVLAALNDTTIPKIYRVVVRRNFKNWFHEHTATFLRDLQEFEDRAASAREFEDSAASAQARVALRSATRNQHFCPPPAAT